MIASVQYEKFSFAVFRIEAFAPTGAALSGHATGFIIRWEEVLYFVTNKHVVTQNNFFNGEPLRKDFCGLPRKLGLYSALRISQESITARDITSLQNSKEDLGSMPQIELPVSNESGDLDRGWKISEEADVAVYLLDEIHGVKKLGPVSFGFGFIEGDELNERVTARAMADCFIIGFPELGDLYRDMKSPIYKSAALAVEPELCRANPLLVDGKTKPGMSGSPVIFRCHNCGKWHLLGVYAGRELADPELTKSELGMVWGFKEHILPVINKFSSRTPAR